MKRRNKTKENCRWYRRKFSKSSFVFISLGLLLFLSACGINGGSQAVVVAASSIPSAAASTPALSVSSTPKMTTTPTSEPTVVPTTEPEPETTSKLTYIDQVICTANDYLNIRSSPDINASVIGALPSGETADVIEYLDQWAYISYDNTVGYVSRAYITKQRSPEVSVPMGDWAKILVNPSRYLPDGFQVALAGFEGGQVDERILDVCEQMFADAEEDGVMLQLVDAYRSQDRQNELYQKKVNSFIAKGYSQEDAETEAATITARPGTSEHQTGLALDIVTPSYTKMDKGFANTDAFKWLNANAQNYGFTLRYKKDKVSITQVIYEPWHWRFVGVEAAAEMKDNGMCLEEYFG